MVNPAIEVLLSKVDNRYTLVVETSKRARQLVDGAPKLVECESEKPVTIATNEIAEDKVHYERSYDGIK